MKRIISLLLVFALLLPCVGVKAEAATSGTCGDNLAWTFDEVTGTVTISGTGEMWDDMYGPQNPWTGGALNNSIKVVVVEDGVTSIAGNAFYDLPELTSVSIGNDVTSIGGHAFDRCEKLETVTIHGNQATICEGAFSACTALNSLTLENGVASIGKMAFYGCSGLTTLTIPDSVTNIGEWAFVNCVALETVTLGEGVTEIGELAFSGCTALTGVRIPNSVTAIGRTAFSRCESLASLTIGTGVASIGDYAFQGTGLTDVTIPGNVASIGDGAFTGCDALANVTLCEGITSIGGSAFGNCPALTSITIPSTVTSMGTNIFMNSYNLASVTLREGITSIGDSAFGNSALTSVTIPGSVTSIGVHAFDGCDTLTSVTICDGSVSIGDYAFYGCKGLETVTIGEGNTSIGRFAFSGCEVLSSLTLGEGMTSIDSYAFERCPALTSVTIPGSLTNMGSDIFLNCAALETVTINEGVSRIGDGMFNYCNALTTVTIPRSVTAVGGSAFSRCSSLTDVYYSGTEEMKEQIDFTYANEDLLNATWHYEEAHECVYTPVVTAPTCTEGGYTTYTCTCGDSYTADEVAATGHSFGDWVQTKAPTVSTKGEERRDCANCDHYETRKVETVTSGSCGDNLTWSIDPTTKALTISGTGNMWDYEHDHNSEGEPESTNAPWWGYGIKSLVVESGVTSIGECAFDGCYNLESVTVADSVTRIGDLAFYYCTSMNSLTLGEGVTRIGDSAFSFCRALRTVTLPGSMRYLGCSAFGFCGALENVTICEGATTIGEECTFEYCRALKSMTIPRSVTSIGFLLFEGCSALSDIYYSGTSEEKEILLGDDEDNPALLNATWHCQEAVELTAPTIKASAVASTGKTKLSWSAVSGADFYRIYRSTSKSGGYTYLKSTRSTSYTDTTAKAGTNYYYKVKAVVEETDETSAYSNIVNRCCDLAKPVVTLKVDTASGKPKVTFEKISGAEKYYIVRSTSKTGTYSKLATITGTSYIDTSAKAGTNYYYKVKALHAKDAADSAYSDITNRVCDLAKPTVSISYNSTSGKPVVKWETVSGAAKYRVYRSTKKDSGYELVYTAVTARTYTDTAAKAGTNYYYKVKAVHTNSSADSAYSAIVNRMCDLAKPVISITRSNGDPKVSWETVEGAEKYEIWRATSKTGTYKKVKTAITARSFTDTSATAGKTYYYKVRAIHSNSAANSAYSAIKSIAAK